MSNIGDKQLTVSHKLVRLPAALSLKPTVLSILNEPWCDFLIALALEASAQFMIFGGQRNPRTLLHNSVSVPQKLLLCLVKTTSHF